MGKKLTIEEMQRIAKERGGKCLSTEYINGRTKLKWKCKEGHQWEKTPDHIIYDNQWCPKCSRIEQTKRSRKYTIEDIIKIAEEKKGKCLSKEYINFHSKLKWQCEKGHNFETSLACVKSMGRWCPYCAGKNKTIEDMQRLAKERGGKCLSIEFKGVKTKLRWRCKEGHEWENTPDHIINGKQWCPICSTGISERICLKTFENIFNSKFPKRKPKWLVKSKGIRMELDGYNKELGLAFEFQGVQHYKFVDRFHKSEEDLIQRKLDDELKRTLCKTNNVILIEVPHYIENEELRNYVINECRKNGIKIPSQTSLKAFDYRTFVGIYSPEKLKKMQRIAKNKGGMCLSKEYIDDKTKLRWRCKENHEWEAVPSHINQGRWCPHCAGHVRLTIEKMQDIAEKRGGKCLSKIYINNSTKLKWRCKEGHEWEATLASINHGSWCPHCAGNARLTIERMQNVARERGGKCLSKVYKGANTKLTWQCKDGHEWKATPHHIKNAGTWCPICAKEKRKIRK